MSKFLSFLPAVVVTMLTIQCAPAAAQNMGNHNNFANQSNNEGVQIDSSSDNATVANARGGAGGSVSVGSGAVNNSLSFQSAKRSADTAVASPPTVVGTDSCLIPWGAAGQSTVFGLSLGGAQEDATCRRIKLAREYAGMGWSNASAAMHCYNGTEAVVAMRSQGIDCRLLTGGSVTDAAFNGVAPLSQDICFRANGDAILYGALKRKGMCQ